MASLFLGDLNDFLAPSSECVNPVFTANGGAAGQGLLNVSTISENELDAEAAAALKINSEAVVKFSGGKRLPEGEKNGSGPFAISLKSPKFQIAKVQLSDCLACSGCLTSAETVLFQQQTSSALAALEGVSDAPKFVSLSSASRAALAMFFGVSATESGLGLLQALKSLGRLRLVDAGFAHGLVLDAALEEFLDRYEQHHKAPEAPRKKRQRGRHAVRWEKEGDLRPRAPDVLPVLASECPGWVCYVEKSAPEALPLLSRVKSSLRVMGWMSKVGLQDAHAEDSSTALHISVQPCADKKLEAARKDSLKEVDITLTTEELIDYLLQVFEQERTSATAENDASQIDFPATPRDWFHSCVQGALQSATEEQLSLLAVKLVPDSEDAQGSPRLVWTGLPVSGSAGSGGYAEYIFRGAAKRLFDIDIGQDPLPWAQARNADSHVLVLNADGSVGGSGDGDEKPLLVFAKAYGFRNIQGLLGNFRRGHAKHDYVEVMACPSGCSNGGGQPRTVQDEQPSSEDEPSNGREVSPAVLAAAVERLQHEREVGALDATDMTRRISKSGLTTKQEFLLADYQAVPKLQSMSSSGLKW